jgi:hypothetical protein
MELSAAQERIIHADTDTKILLSGAAGTGKTTTGVARLRYLLESGIAAKDIFVMLPQRTLAAPYIDLLDDPALPPGSPVDVATLGGLARRACDLFWPLVAAEHGFAQPEKRPTFLSLETAQYFMARVIGPELSRQAYFQHVKADPNRLYSQVIDNLNKAAVIDAFEHTEIGEHLKAAWLGGHEQLQTYDDVQAAANAFRAYCLQHNLLDFSLQVELFLHRLWPLDTVKKWIFQGAKHVIVDNVEEDTPAAHRIMHAIIAEAESALVIYDEDAAYRRFLGADEDSAMRQIADVCDDFPIFMESFVTPPALESLGAALTDSLGLDAADVLTNPREGIINIGVDAPDNRYYTQMIDDAVTQITYLHHEQGVPAQEIVVIAPYVSDSLRFSLMNRLEANHVPVRSHRPSRSLRQEPAAQCMLTLSQFAHPNWGFLPSKFDIVAMLMQAIANIDLVRAQIIADTAYSVDNTGFKLKPFERFNARVQERITYTIGERYERLRTWLETHSTQDDLPLDHFFSRLFGEVLSQPGFGFHQSDDVPNRDAARVAADLIDSALKFRRILETSNTTSEDRSIGHEFVLMVTQGLIADQYLGAWHTQADEAVLIAPAYTYLLSNRPVDYQFWLSVGGVGWSERVYQPLTNPYVLTQHWPFGQKWTDDHEVMTGIDALRRLILGLVRRCRKSIYMGYSTLSEQGYEQRGELLQSVQKMLMRYPLDDTL